MAGIQFTLLLTIAEAKYPGYSVGTNLISDLGIWDYPSAIYFNVSVIVFGSLALAAAILLWRENDLCRIAPLTAISGIGGIGVGLFPENLFNPIHVISATLVFGVGGLACVHCYRIAGKPLRFVFLGTGILSLVSAIMFVFKIDLGLGIGTIERMVCYPIVIWVMMLGVLLLCEKEPQRSCSV